MKSSHQEVIWKQAGPSFFRAWLDVVCWAWSESFDVFFTQKFNPLTLAGLMVAKLRGKRTIVDWDDWDTGLQRNWMFTIVMSICETIGPHVPDVISSHSTTIKKKVPTKTTFRWISQSIESPSPHSSGNHIHSLLKTLHEQNKGVIAYVCTFTSGGSAELPSIIQAWARESCRNHLVIFGDGPLKHTHQDLIDSLGLAHMIHLAGWVDRSQLAHTLRLFDAGLIWMADTPANRARVSLKTLHYFQAGIPVFGQAVGETLHQYGAWITPTSLADLACMSADQFKSRHIRFDQPNLLNQMEKDLQTLIHEEEKIFSMEKDGKYL
ncbi:MAG: hypothetical protein R3A11_03215 [Bdellovibrionota bacterium]